MKKIALTILFVLIAGQSYSQNYLKNLWGKDSSNIVVVEDNSTVLNRSFFTLYNQHIYDLMHAIRQRGYSADDFASLAAAIDTAAIDTAMVIVASRQNIAETEPDTLPATAILWIRNGGRINVTRKFLIEGRFIDPGPIQVFEGNLDSLEFAPGSVDYVRPEWFGGSNSMSVQYAVNSIIGKGSILLGGWDYDINSTIRIYDDSLSIIGNKFNTLFYRTVDDTVFALYGTDKSNRVEQIVISGIRFDGTSSFTSPYVYASYFGKSVIKDFNFEDVTGPAVRLIQPWDILIANGRFDRCGSDGDSTKAGLTITSGTGDNANNVRIIDVTFENGRGGHLSILGENGGGLDHGFYIIQSKFHGWGDSTSRATYNPTSPFIYADSLENLSVLQCRFAWSPDSGPIIKAVKVGNFSISYSDFASQVNHPIFDFTNCTGVTLISNSFNRGPQVESDSLFGDLLTDNRSVALINNILLENGEDFDQWDIQNKFRFANNDTVNFKLLKFMQIDSASQGNYLVIQPDDISGDYQLVRFRSDGHILLKRSSTAQNVDLYPHVNGLLISERGFDAGSGAIQGGAEVKGTATFSGTATSDTILISGITASDAFVLTVRDATPIADDMLSYTVTTDTLFVHRVAGTTNNLQYTYIRIKSQ